MNFWRNWDCPRRNAYGEVFRNHTGLDPHDETDDVLMNEARSLGLSAADPDRHLLLDFLFSHRVGPHLGLERPCFVYDYPAGQAALARVREDPAGHRAVRVIYQQNGNSKRIQ